jgi:transposase-like protein
MSTSLAKPAGYDQRIRLVLDSIATMPSVIIARACGVNESTVSRWRSGAQVPSDPATLARLARVDLGLLVFGPTERLEAALRAVSE